MKFNWNDRVSCIRRIAALMNCIEGMTMDKAIDAAIHKVDEYGHGYSNYRYCNDPALITPVQLEKLRKDAHAFLDIPAKLIAVGVARVDG